MKIFNGNLTSKTSTGHLLNCSIHPVMQSLQKSIKKIQIQWNCRNLQTMPEICHPCISTSQISCKPCSHHHHDIGKLQFTDIPAKFHKILEVASDLKVVGLWSNSMASINFVCIVCSIGLVSNALFTKNQVTTTSRSQSWEPNPQTTQLQCRTTRQVSQVQTSPQPMQNTVTSRTRQWNHKLSVLPHTQESDVSAAMLLWLLSLHVNPSAFKPRASWKSL